MLAGVKEKIGKAIEAMLQNRFYHALLHVPLVGGFALLVSSPVLIGRRGQLSAAVKTGLAAQLVVPGVFALGSVIRYVTWLLQRDAMAALMGWALLVYLVAGYAFMAYNAYLVVVTGESDYRQLRPWLDRVSEWVLG